MISRKRLSLFAVLVAILGGVFSLPIALKYSKSNSKQSLDSLVTEHGPPDLLAKRAEVAKRRVKAVRVLVSAVDPKSISDWTTTTNQIAIWGQSEPCKQNIRYFYDEWKNDPKFDGGGWYSSRPLFGEALIIASVGEGGYATNIEVLKVDAISMELDGFVRTKVNKDRIE